MIKEFIKRSCLMLLYACGAAALSTLIIILSFYNNYKLFDTSVLLIQISTTGIVIGLPILILSAFWFWHVRNKTNFLLWAVVPFLLSLIEVAIGVEMVEGFKEDNFSIKQLMFLFSFSSFQTAFYMWLTYSKFKKLEIDTPVISQPTMEVQNASN